MVLMSVLVRLPLRAIAVIRPDRHRRARSVRLLAGVLPPPARVADAVSLLGGEVARRDAIDVSVLYSIVPWIGVMAAGYAFGAVVLREPAARDRLSWRIGLTRDGAVPASSPASQRCCRARHDGPPALFQVLNQRKYPASQLFLLMTLGPSIAFLPLAERARGLARERARDVRPRADVLLPAPHPADSRARLDYVVDSRRRTHSEWFLTAPYVPVPPEQQWSLPLLYLVFAIAVVLLYFPCRWFADVKARGGRPWLRFL